MNKLNLKKLNTSNVIVQGSEFAIEDKETGKVYITNKSYIDKLFKEMGYRNLNVVKILEEFAGKFVSDIGSLTSSHLYVDDTTDAFVVATSHTVDSVNNLISWLNEENFEVIEVRRPDTYYYWDQWFIKSPEGFYFALYVDLCDEYIHVLSLDYDTESKCLKSICDEGIFRFSEDVDDTDELNLKSLLKSNISNLQEVSVDQDLSISEFVNLLVSLGYAKKKRGRVCLTDDGEEAQKSQEILKDVEDVIDDYNSMSWILRHIRQVKNGFKFTDACRLISLRLNKVRFWDIKDFYKSMINETSDMFALNSSI